jgi:hypothetical protein
MLFGVPSQDPQPPVGPGLTPSSVIMSGLLIMASGNGVNAIVAGSSSKGVMQGGIAPMLSLTLKVGLRPSPILERHVLGVIYRWGTKIYMPISETGASPVRAPGMSKPISDVIRINGATNEPIIGADVKKIIGSYNFFKSYTVWTGRPRSILYGREDLDTSSA